MLLNLSHIKPYIIWLQLHPEIAAVVTFGISFIECLAVIGLIVPGTVMMTAIGALVGAVMIPAGSTILAAILGAIAGDVISFWLGSHFHDRVPQMWPFRRFPKLLKKGQDFFDKHGGTGVFFGRFLGPIRPILPLVAGMMNMSTSRFLFADICSAILWAPTYLLPGIILGAASQELPPQIASRVMFFVIIVLLILWFFSWLIKKLVVAMINFVHYQLDKLWIVIKHERWLKPLHIALQDPQHPHSHNQLTLALYWLFAIFLFIALILNVMNQGDLITLNNIFWNFMRTVRGSQGDKVFISFTLIGEAKVLSVMYFAVLAWLCFRKAWRTVVHWILLGVFTFAGVEILKALVHSPRPGGLIQSPKGFSFPSGHATLSTAFFGMLAVLISRELRSNLRWIPYTFAFLICLSIGFSRVYLGAHWLTDVIGGYLLGLIIVMFVVLSYRRQFTPSVSPIGLFLVALCSLMITWGLYSAKHYREYLHNYTPYLPAYITNTSTWWTQQLPTDVLYRTNREGKVVDILNVQWAGNLTEIEQGLTQHGWVVTPSSTIGIILNRISDSKHSFALPLLPQLYMDKRPSLVMSKLIKPDNLLLVLRLWDAKTTFSDSQLPLWVGTIRYDYHLEKEYLHTHKNAYVPVTAPAIQLLSNDLSGFSWKMVAYPQVPIMDDIEDTDWNGYVLLVKPQILFVPSYQQK